MIGYREVETRSGPWCIVWGIFKCVFAKENEKKLHKQSSRLVVLLANMIRFDH